MACAGCRGVPGLAARVVAMMRIDALWLATAPIDMRMGTERLLAQVVHPSSTPKRCFERFSMGDLNQINNLAAL